MKKILFLIAFACTSLAQATNEIPASASMQCRMFIRQLPPEVKWGFIEVPEKWDVAESEKISVFYYMLEKKAGSSKKTPYIFFNGGPAGNSHNTLDMFLKTAQSREMTAVTLDQRGTGCSGHFPEEPNAENIKRLAHWGSEGIVRDAEALRQHLFGEQKWNALGSSFGGRVVFRYLEKFPDGLASAHIHGFGEMKSFLDLMFLRQEAQHRLVEEYLGQSGMRRQLADLYRMVGDEFCVEDGFAKICGDAVLDSLSGYVGFQEAWPILTQTIGQIHSDMSGGDSQSLKDMVRRFGLRTSGWGSTMVPMVLNMYEITDGHSDGESCRKVEERLRKAGKNTADWMIYECRLLAAIQHKTIDFAKIKVTPSPVSLATVKTNLETHPALKTYLYSGAKDSFVPPETFAETVRELGSLINYKSFPNSGHRGYRTEPLLWNNLLREAEN